MTETHEFDRSRPRRREAGTGTFGCILSLALIALAVFVGVRIGPIYYSNKSLEGDVNTEVSRAGANFLSDESLVNSVLDLARKNEIRLARNEVKIERFAGQIHLTIRYTVPVDFILLKKDLNFEIKTSSFVGRL